MNTPKELEKLLEGSNTPNIMILGERGSGKDTAANWLIGVAGYQRFSFGDEIRGIIRMFGIDQPKREHLVAITEFAYKMLGENVWINLAIKKFEKFKKENNKPIVITDMRYPDIYAHFLNKGFFPIKLRSNSTLNIHRVIERDGRYPDKLRNDRSEKHDLSGYDIWNEKDFAFMYKQLQLLLFLLGDKEFYDTNMTFFTEKLG